MSTASRQFYSTRRILRSGFVNLFRNAWLTVAATAVMIVALTIILIGVIVNVTTSNAIDVLSQELKTTIILKEGVDQNARLQLEQRLESFEFVQRADYISPQEAQSRLTDDPVVGEGVLEASELFAGEDFLQPSYEVSLNDLSRADELNVITEDSDFAGVVDRIALGKTDTGKQTDAEKAIERAAAVERFITFGSIVSAAILSAVSIMIIFNTIRMAIYTRRDEIRIMKLIGATPDYIRGPFLVEASLYGVFAGLISSAAVYSLILTLGKSVENTREFGQTYDFFTNPSSVVAVVLGSLLVGILIGVVSSMLAMEKHLKLKHW